MLFLIIDIISFWHRSCISLGHERKHKGEKDGKNTKKRNPLPKRTSKNGGDGPNLAGGIFDPAKRKLGKNDGGGKGGRLQELRGYRLACP